MPLNRRGFTMVPQDVNQPVLPQSVPPSFSLNENLENQAVNQGNNPMNPIVGDITRRFGFLNFLRNRANQEYVDPETNVQGGVK